MCKPTARLLRRFDRLLKRSYRQADTVRFVKLLRKQRLAGLRTVFPDLQITIDDMIAEGDRVVYRGTARGTQQVAFQGIAPTGKQIAVSVIEIFRIENGKIAEHWGGPDIFGVLQDLGVTCSVPPAKQ